jgi:hypothetical protein
VSLSAAAGTVGGLAEANGSKRKHLEARGSKWKNQLKRPNPAEWRGPGGRMQMLNLLGRAADINSE